MSPAPTRERLHAARVLVVGDAMLDRYWFGAVDRISPEAPIPVLTMQKEERMLGGAGNVVRNLLALGARAALVSVIGGPLPTGRHRAIEQVIRTSFDLFVFVDIEMFVELFIACRSMPAPTRAVIENLHRGQDLEVCAFSIQETQHIHEKPAGADLLAFKAVCDRLQCVIAIALRIEMKNPIFPIAGEAERLNAGRLVDCRTRLLGPLRHHLNDPLCGVTLP